MSKNLLITNCPSAYFKWTAMGIFKNKEKYFEMQQEEYVRFDDLPLLTSDGRKIYVEFVSNVYMANNTKVIQCNIRDITENWQIKSQIAESEEKFRTITEIGRAHV